MNTKILSAEFEYFSPETLQEAVERLDQLGPKARLIAGGTDLLVQMKKEAVSPSYLVDLRRIAEINFIHEDKGGLRIGAATKWREIAEFCARRPKYAALYEASRALGNVQIRNMATIGGNLCSASPAADSAPALLVLNSRVKLASVQGERILGLENFFKGVKMTALAANEVMKEIQIPAVPDRMGSAFMKITRVSADISKINCAVALERQGDVCVSCRIAMGAVAPLAMRMDNVLEIVVGKKVDDALIEKLGQKVSEEIKPINDIRSTAAYRRKVSVVLLKDVFWKAWHRAAGRER